MNKSLEFSASSEELLEILKMDEDINLEFREMFNITDRTALNDLKSLCDKGLLKKIGKTGRSTEYILAEINRKTRNKPEINPKYTK